MKKTWLYYSKLVFQLMFKFIFFGALLFVPAQTLDWPAAWDFLITFCLLTIFITIILDRFYPKTLEARLSGFNASNQPLYDKLATPFFIIMYCFSFVMIPIDRFYLQLSAPMPVVIHYVGIALFLIGYGIVFFAMIQNEFIAPVVTIQKERGHVLRDQGLYAYIRHPLYLGLIIFFIGMGLWLDSVAGTVAGLVILLMALLPRLFIEEATLIEQLNGYREYTKRVRYRLCPFIW